MHEGTSERIVAAFEPIRLPVVRRPSTPETAETQISSHREVLALHVGRGVVFGIGVALNNPYVGPDRLG
jgi:hypothetical protein